MVTRQPRVSVWFAATFVLFFARAFIFASWVSRGPEVMDDLHINTVQMGLLTMLFPIGGLLAIGFASGLVQRFGSRVVGFGAFLIACTAFALLGPAISAGSIVLAGILLVLTGAPIAVTDFVGNYEGTLVDRASKHSLFPAINSAYGVGMLLAALLSGILAGIGVGLGISYVAIGLVIAMAACVGALALPNHPRAELTPEMNKVRRRQSRRVWTEKRSLMIALIGFTFVMSETSAGTWMPIALADSGFSHAAAAFSLSIFWIVVTAVRMVGGWVIDRIGRYPVVLLSILLTVVGIVVFMLDGFLHMPYVGLGLWAAGTALGFPLSTLSMSDDPVLAAARVNMIITIVYLASVTVGPALGGVGQAFGLFVAFSIPVVLLMASALVSKATKPSTVY